MISYLRQSPLLAERFDSYKFDGIDIYVLVLSSLELVRSLFKAYLLF